ncbi:MAG: HAMP domain-containing protein [Candidatus Eremiobacteraeota bacterium]|nr:HAMP domain-containing protein [Candidatus Eremiobacteraeota bacterium]
MKLSIGQKIFASLFLTCAVLVLVMLTTLRLSLGRGLEMRTSALIGTMALALSTITAAALSAHLRRPLLRLLRGTQKLAGGDYQTRITVEAGDELGQLARRFNHLAHTLERGNESRKQWIADVSHELRTPLAVLRAEVEALQDGVRPANAEAFELLHGQVMALTALTEDLFQLARADLGQLNYKMREVELWKLLQEASEPFQSRYAKAGLELSVVQETARLQAHVWGDPDRLRQLLSNLLENSLRYTEAPGRVELRCQDTGTHWRIRLDDSPPAVAAEMRDRLFERFFRVEPSRSKKLGGAGLGLSICNAIAQAHEGQLRAAASPLGGLRVEFTLPMAKR